MVALISIMFTTFMSLNIQSTLVPEGVLVLDIDGQIVIHRTKSSRIIVSTEVYTNFSPEISKHLRNRWSHENLIQKGEFIRVTMHKSNSVVMCHGVMLEEKFVTHVYLPEKVRYFNDNTSLYEPKFGSTK
jgi:hypothetical protein